MALMGLDVATGLAPALAFVVLAVLWRYSDLPDVEWAEITSGIMTFVTAAGLDVLAGSNALGLFTQQASNLRVLTALLVLVGGLLVLVGGVRNAINALQ